MREKRYLALLFIVSVLGVLFTSAMGVGAETVTLTLGSWRVDDVEQVNKLLDAFHQSHPNIHIRFNPTNPPDYNAVLRTQLTGGTGPDLMYVRSFKVGQDLFTEGYLEPLTGMQELEENYSEGSRDAWSLNDVPFAVPFMAVSHGVYYNVELFAKHNLQIPETWMEVNSEPTLGCGKSTLDTFGF